MGNLGDDPIEEVASSGLYACHKKVARVARVNTGAFGSFVVGVHLPVDREPTMQVPSSRADLVLELFDAYYERVYAFLRRSTSPEIADDLAQEVFVRLLQHPQLEELTISVSYLIKIAHNLMRRRFARASRLRELLAERRANDDCIEPAPVVVDARLLDTALGLLSGDEQNAVRLIVCEGKSYQHAAESLGVSITTVNNWKHRGLTKMRKMLVEGDDALREADRTAHHRPGRNEAMPEQRSRSGRVGPKPGWSHSHGWSVASDDVA